MIKNRLFQLLSKYNLKIATAESCTGGLVAATICDISGVSTYFEEGYITYSENAKCKNLGVLPETIEHFGVVSCEVAEEMAMGIAERANADCSIATTGFAGPTGGTDENPVGTVCFACVVKNQVLTERMIFDGDRMEIRNQATIYALEMLCDYIESIYGEI